MDTRVAPPTVGAGAYILMSSPSASACVEPETVVARVGFAPARVRSVRTLRVVVPTTKHVRSRIHTRSVQGRAPPHLVVHRNATAASACSGAAVACLEGGVR